MLITTTLEGMLDDCDTSYTYTSMYIQACCWIYLARHRFASHCLYPARRFTGEFAYSRGVHRRVPFCIHRANLQHEDRAHRQIPWAAALPLSYLPPTQHLTRGTSDTASALCHRPCIPPRTPFVSSCPLYTSSVESLPFVICSSSSGYKRVCIAGASPAFGT